MQQVALSQDAKIVIAGAGSIGCFVGGWLKAAGREVTFLGRPRIMDQLRTHGLHVTDHEDRIADIEANSLSLEIDPAAAFGEANVILVTVKSGATGEMAKLIADHAPTNALVISLQNGVSNASVLRDTLPGQKTLAGMVPYNVVQMGEGRFHRGTDGVIVIEAGVDGLAEFLNVDRLVVLDDPDIDAVQWGKLLINLNNALNALSGLPLRTQIATREWRRLFAVMISEALPLLKKSGVKPKAALPIPPGLLPHMLRLPNSIYGLLARRMTRIDPKARSSMWEDLEQGRKTEIAELQGAVVALAKKHDAAAPVCERVMTLIHAAEEKGRGSPQLSPMEVWSD